MISLLTEDVIDPKYQRVDWIIGIHALDAGGMDARTMSSSCESGSADRWPRPELCRSSLASNLEEPGVTPQVPG